MIKKRLVQLLSHAKKHIVFQVLWQWLALLCQIVMIYCLAVLVNCALGGLLTAKTILSYALAAAAAMALRFLCDRQASYASYEASVDVKRILREKIYEKLLRLGAAYRESTSTSAVVQMAVEGVDQLETYFGRYLPQLFYSLLAPLTLFAVLSFINFKASLVLLIFVPLIPISIVIVQKIGKKLIAKYWGAYEELGDSFLENLQGMTTLKIYRADRQKAEEMDRESEHFRKITMKVLTMQLNSTSVMDIMAYGGAAVGMIVALTEFAKGNATFGGTLMILLLASEFFIPLRLLGSFFHIAMNGMAASDRIFELLDLPEPEQGTETLGGGRIGVVMDGVHFAYEKDREILSGIRIEVPEGSFVSLVGRSGCGKSTVAGILMGRNKGYEGSIRVQGKELSQISEHEIMENVTLVTHESYLFKGTVRDNLLMGDPGATEEQMEQVLREVNLLDFLREQEGLDTKLQERGNNLSGGQCQRLALARALLHDTPMYIFDEATSNIDVESEEMIMEVIRKLSGSRTVLLISHRLANVTGSDRIYMLRDGEIVQSGRHEELMTENGEYADLYRYQKELEEYGKNAGTMVSGKERSVTA